MIRPTHFAAVQKRLLSPVAGACVATHPRRRFIVARLLRPAADIFKLLSPAAGTCDEARPPHRSVVAWLLSLLAKAREAFRPPRLSIAALLWSPAPLRPAHFDSTRITRPSYCFIAALLLSPAGGSYDAIHPPRRYIAARLLSPAAGA